MSSKERVQNEIPSEDKRTPEQRHALIAWAHRYCAAGERTLEEQREDRQR